MGTHLDLRHNGSVIRYDPDGAAPFEPRVFDSGWLKQTDHHRGNAAGRGAAHFLHFGGRDMVLRPYLRGGLARKISRDLFLYTGFEHTRSMREFALTNWMHAQGLPVPRAVAAQVTQVGPLYRAAIVTERIPDARPMEDHLRAGPINADLWHRVGKTVRRMHDAGVYHSDLNRRNILIDGNADVWLIDFDKCDRRAPGSWTQDNLSRLHRSLAKDDQQGPMHWTPDDWHALQAGYQGQAPRPLRG